ncbi:hypothetical protein JCM6882_003109 [Rhodosporidiobolus microsporus]
MSTTPDAELHNCAVCEKKTASVCSGCNTTFFCSREHQKLVYPTHKHLCGGPSDACYFPTLTADEVAALLEGEDGRGRSGRGEDLLGDLASSASTIEEPRRSRILAFLHQNLAPQGDRPWAEFREHPWREFATFQRSIFDPDLSLLPGLEVDQPASEDPFRRLNRLYQQLLILHTLFSRAAEQPPPLALTRGLIKLATERARKLVQEACFPPVRHIAADSFLDIMFNSADGKGLEAEAILALPE